MAIQTKLGIVILEEQPFMRSAFAREIEDHSSLELRGVSGSLNSVWHCQCRGGSNWGSAPCWLPNAHRRTGRGT
jgi:hypothetical protein